MATGKWRVVTESGEVRSFVVLPPAADHIPLVDGGGYVAHSDDESFHGDGYTAREAVTLLAVSVMGLAVVEILAPGECSRAEEIARLTAALDGVRREERERCKRECMVIAGELSYDFRLRQGMHAAERCAKAIGALPDAATGSAT